MDQIASSYEIGTDGTGRFFYDVDSLVVGKNAMRHACARLPHHLWTKHVDFGGWRCRCKVECATKSNHPTMEWFARNATHPDKVSVKTWYTLHLSPEFWSEHRVCKSHVVPPLHEAWLCLCGDTGRVWVCSWNLGYYVLPS
jgi:hypothetical protein